MANHSLEVNFNVASDYSDTKINRDELIIRKMAEVLCPPDAPFFPLAIVEAEKVYKLVKAMQAAIVSEKVTM